MNNKPMTITFPIRPEPQINDHGSPGTHEETRAQVTFVRELTLRYRGQKRHLDEDAIRMPEKAAEFMRRVLPDNVREHFLVLILNGANCVVGYFVAATGGANFCYVMVREVFQAAIAGGATSIIIGHNHPTEHKAPSEADRAMTKRLRECGKLLGINVLDHIIITSHDYYSFTDNREMEPET